MTIHRPGTHPEAPSAVPARHVTPHHRRRLVARLMLALLFAVHGLIQLVGFAAAAGLVELPLGTEPAPQVIAVGWLTAGLLSWLCVVLLFKAPARWWATGLAAVVVSQTMIMTDWSDARAGTAVNTVLAVAVLYGFASHGPWSLQAEFDRVTSAARPLRPAAPVAEADLAGLPDPVQRYLRLSGVVGKTPVRDFRATWTGRMRSSPDSAWMPFTADQLDTVDPPRRFFKMNATMKGLPVDVLHVFDERGATMRVRLCSVRSMVDAGGPALTRAETVTLFNDLCFYAPSALLGHGFTWDPVDNRTAVGRLTVGVNTVAAELHFSDNGDLTDFVSDDRTATSPDGRLLAPVRWSTPIQSYAQFGSVRVPAGAEVKWHPPSGSWTYGEFQLTSLSYDTGHPAPVTEPSGHNALASPLQAPTAPR